MFNFVYAFNFVLREMTFVLIKQERLLYLGIHEPEEKIERYLTPVTSLHLSRSHILKFPVLSIKAPYTGDHALTT